MAAHSLARDHGARLVVIYVRAPSVVAYGELGPIVPDPILTPADVKDKLSTMHVFDPWVDAEEARRECGITPISQPQIGHYDAIVLAVAHDLFRELGADGVRRFGKDPHVLYDVKYLFGREDADLRL